MRYKVTPPPTPSNIKSLSFSSPRCGGIEGGARRGLNMYLIRAETPVIVLFIEDELDEDDESKESVLESLKISLQEAKAVKIHPISELWEGIDVE
ncbi:MAG: hypothetical protein ACKO2Z_09895, partial [Sphaerospermopsis kisseleviana]